MIHDVYWFDMSIPKGQRHNTDLSPTWSGGRKLSKNGHLSQAAKEYIQQISFLDRNSTLDLLKQKSRNYDLGPSEVRALSQWHWNCISQYSGTDLALIAWMSRANLNLIADKQSHGVQREVFDLQPFPVINWEYAESYAQVAKLC